MKHQEIIESLPWYVNGTLSQPERAEIAQHLATGCRECAREVASLTALRKAVVAVGDAAPEPSPRPAPCPTPAEPAPRGRHRNG